MNHYPILGRTPRKSCEAVASDTANPFAHIDCPKCRAFLQGKVSAEQSEALNHSASYAERRFHTGVADHFAGLLAT